MRTALLFALLVAAHGFRASAATDEFGYNEATIWPSDLPVDAPRFEDYPVEVFAGKNAKPALNSSPESRLFRTRLKEWSASKPNFAGNFILATWGCGTSCTQIAIINAKTGQIYHPRNASANIAVNVHESLLAGGDLWHSSGAIWYRADSKLLVLIGMPNEDEKRRGISYFVWRKNQLSLLRFVPKLG